MNSSASGTSGVVWCAPAPTYTAATSDGTGRGGFVPPPNDPPDIGVRAPRPSHTPTGSGSVALPIPSEVNCARD